MYKTKQEAIVAINKNHGFNTGEFKSFFDDKDVVLTAVAHDGYDLQYASIQLKQDREVVLAAVKQDGRALQFAAPVFRSDRELVLVAAHSDGLVLSYVSDNLKDDNEVLLAAVSNRGESLKDASERLQNDKELILLAFKQYASEAIRKNDKNHILENFNFFAKYVLSYKSSSEEIQQLCKGQDPVEALTKAINYEMLTKKLAPVAEIEQPRRKLKI